MDTTEKKKIRHSEETHSRAGGAVVILLINLDYFFRESASTLRVDAGFTEYSRCNFRCSTISV